MMSGFLVEEAIKFLVAHFPKERIKKPSLFHSLRVASYLYLQGYSEEICIAWLLHDSIEDTPITKDMIEEKFGIHVATIVEVNSKNMSLPKEKILEDIVQRCANYGEDAMIVKIVEVYDNFLFYTRQVKEWEELQSEIERCKFLANLVLRYKKKEWENSAFKLATTIDS